MTSVLRELATGLTVCLVAVSCAGGETRGGQSAPSATNWPDVTSEASSDASGPVPTDQSELLFDPTVMHEVTMEINERDLDQLDPPTDDRVPAALTVDGRTAYGVGVRLKQGAAQFQGLDEKPGFSIETDEFVAGLELFDVDRFTLGNAALDHSFVAEQLVYDLFRAANIPAARTALARVTVNGETFGIYVMRETYDVRWLAQYFEDPSGNLYETPGGPDDMVLELRTNERLDDTSDLATVVEVVETASDEEYRDAIEQLVDVDELLTYWAVEAVAAHWDGYAYDVTAPGLVPPPARPPGNPWPNNFYVYHDPGTDKFVFIPHGADLALGLGAGSNYDVDPSMPVLVAPKEGATIASRLWGEPEVRTELAERIRWVLEEVWDADALTERAELFAALVRADGLTGSREYVTMAQFEDALAARKDFIARRATAVVAELATWESGDGSGEGP